MELNTVGFVNSPGGGYPEQKVSRDQLDMEKARLEQEVAAQKRHAQQEENEKELEKPVVEVGKFVMSERDMKELLLMMGSRGDTKTIEKLVEIARLEKQLSEKR